MRTKLKRLDVLDKEISKRSIGKRPVLILDTGGLIDIAQATRLYGLNGNRKTERNPTYMDTVSFLKKISYGIPLVVTPRTYREIQEHSRTMLNEHVPELGLGVLDYSLQTMTDSVRLIDNFVPAKGFSFDDARYDAHWAAREGCKGIHKKCLEECSDADKEILATAAYLSKSRDYGELRIKTPVLILSPDAHITEGSEFLRNNFGDRYSSIVPISTRT